MTGESPLMSIAKAVLLIVWLVLFSCFFVATSSTASLLGRLGFWLMATVHMVECAVFLPRLSSAPGPLFGHLLRTLVFGVLHVRDLPSLTTEEAPPSEPATPSDAL
jgi:uncharacterized protein YhhL (DUF1145 family)